MSCSLDNVTIIRDRATGEHILSFHASCLLTSLYAGMSKSFGFAQFTSVDEARRFLEPNFPFVIMPPPSHSTSGAPPPFPIPEEARRVKIDFSQSANPAENAAGRRRFNDTGANDGTRDIGSAHVPVILLRGLDVGSTLDTIAEAMRGSGGVGKQAAKGMKRILLIKDRVSKISLGIAFVEFVDVQVRDSEDFYLPRF